MRLVKCSIIHEARLYVYLSSHFHFLRPQSKYCLQLSFAQALPAYDLTSPYCTRPIFISIRSSRQKCQKVRRGIALLFHDRGTRSGQQHALAALYPQKDPAPMVSTSWTCIQRPAVNRHRRRLPCLGFLVYFWRFWVTENAYLSLS